MSQHFALPAAVAVCVAFLCVASLATRDHELRTIQVVGADGAPMTMVVEGRRRHPLTPEEQARKDHLKAERAKRFGIFLHYLGFGAASYSTGGLGLLAWPVQVAGSLWSFAWAVGTDALILVGLAFIAVAMVGLYVVCRFVRWIVSPRGK